jgi:hypothetical protein
MKKIDIHVHSRIYLTEEEEKSAIFRLVQKNLLNATP